VNGDEALLDEFTNAARRIAAELHVKLNRKPNAQSAAAAAGAMPPPTAETQQRVEGRGGTVRGWAWLPAVGGVVVGGVGTLFLMQSKGKFNDLTGGDGIGGSQPNLTAREASTLLQDGRREQMMGVVLIGVGGAALVTGGLMYLLGGPSDAPQVAATWTPQGPTFGVTGVLP
jgi:hypothetical protein